MNFFWNRVLLGSTLSVASLFANAAIAAPSPVKLDDTPLEFDALTRDLGIASDSEEVITPNIVQNLPPERIANTSISGFGQESYHLDALIVSPDEEAAQVTSVSQLSDVQPTDWAFQALQSLVERYGCIA